MRRKSVLMGWGVCLFFLLSVFGFAQQDLYDSGAMDTIYINCTSPDFFDQDSIKVSFDFMLWTDATPFSNEVLVAWNEGFIMTSSNPNASARVIMDESSTGAVYKGTSSGYPNEWEARFNSSEPPSGLLPATVIYGAIQDLLPPQNAGPSLSYGRHILAHVIILVKDTTTIHIDTTSTETAQLKWVRSDAVGYKPFWKQPTYCPVTPLTCIYKPGDANGDGRVDLSDLIFILNRIMRGGPAPVFECQADLNADSIVTLLDVVVAVNYLFKGGNPPLKSWACCL